MEGSHGTQSKNNIIEIYSSVNLHVHYVAI